ncbi:MAG TPA: tRNA (adenosine(37)-N6)-threonylcarbamoyltransferase complex ATPase subunit type 1 TsaE [Candidatus Omnitrophota bacterium]|nr:tRNA (adenosine(37)-N6)-threonylcarbamoyltransferase complex ATPase subunit type 1 TsaE [Candidatus Omnitrophota bacterium]HPT39517.1 tRNA (adenosine(37)-N6)-threonylcarbamoyltransferase complex ATPase subunit type 1 TsaE [Candidatus Omnitrophota bacterium]
MEKLSISVNQTLRLGKRIAANLSGGEIILLSGQLGAGKTILAKGIAQGLGINKDDVVSPTFVLLRLYPGKLLLQHFDFYRIKSPQDIFALGYQEYLYSDAVTVIEWPERLKFLLPKEFLKIKLVLKAKDQRYFKFTAKGPRYKELLKKIQASCIF